MPDVEQVLLLTGKLAEPSLRRIATEINQTPSVNTQVVVLPIQVAALLTTEWVAKKLVIPESHDGMLFSRVILPGYCRGDLAPLTAQFNIPFERGPSHVHDLPKMFGQRPAHLADYGTHTLEIIAEINHAPRLSHDEILTMARAYRADGADIIDIGCDPLPMDSQRDAWPGLSDVVRLLRDDGFRVSIDSFHDEEIIAGIAAGAELVLSANSSNAAQAKTWGNPDDFEVVVIPDTPNDLESLDRTIDQLTKDGIAFRIDPIIEPIGFGFAQSLGRYLAVREKYPKAAMMMGIGNLSEMTQVDSAGVNTLLIGFCEELNIASVLTTQVIGWARSSVREIDIARRLMHHAVKYQTPPKHLDDRLVIMRDEKLRELGDDALQELASQLTDPNVRLFAERGMIHAMTRGVYVQGDDPFPLFDQLKIEDPSHAFYLGYEMAKAMTALTLDKNYAQDESLRFGHLTRDEISHHERRKQEKRRRQ